MEHSDDEDPLLLVPRSERRARNRPSRSLQIEIVPVGQPHDLEVVPTSDSEEALEEKIAREGWDAWLEPIPSGFPLGLRDVEEEEEGSSYLLGSDEDVIDRGPVPGYGARSPELSSTRIQRTASPFVRPDASYTPDLLNPGDAAANQDHEPSLPLNAGQNHTPLVIASSDSSKNGDLPRLSTANPESGVVVAGVEALITLDDIAPQEDMVMDLDEVENSDNVAPSEPSVTDIGVPMQDGSMEMLATSDTFEAASTRRDTMLEDAEISLSRPSSGLVIDAEKGPVSPDDGRRSVTTSPSKRLAVQAMPPDSDAAKQTVIALSPTTPRTLGLRARTRSPSLSPVPPWTSPMRMAPRPLSPPPISLPPSEPIPELDPALLAFQNARTFRRRTAIQLQPYTREKTKYRAMVRKGGQLLIAELLHDDPDRTAIAKSLEETEDSQFKEGAEEEDDPEIDMAVSPPVTPDDKDYDEYYQLYGEVAEEASDPRLQLLAKTRLKEERREIRRKARQEREAERYMALLEKELKAKERLRRLQEAAERKKSREESAKERQEQARARLEKRANNSKRPVPKQRNGVKRPSDVIRGATESEGETQPHLKRRRLVRRAHSSEDQEDFSMHSAAEIESASGGMPHLTGNPSQTFEAASSDGSEGALSDYGDATGVGGFVDDELPELTMDPATSPRIPLSSSRTINLTTPGSGTMEDAESDSSDKTAAPREKVKVLKRVMPALQAKRLADKAEADYQARQRRKALQARELEEARRKRPGQAIRRKTNGTTLRQGVDGLFDDDSELPMEDDTPHFALERPPDPMITIFSSDDESEMLSQSDDPSEDDEVERHRKQHFQLGDFSRLLHGTRKGERVASKPKNRSTTILKRSRGSGNTRRSFSRSEPVLRQGRIDFDKTKSARKKATTPRRTKRRLLDDAAIFDLDSTPFVRSVRDNHAVTVARDSTPIRQNQPRSPFGTNDRQRSRRSSTPALAGRTPTSHPKTPQGGDLPVAQDGALIVAEPSDMWDELQEFQVDFAIKPLRAGVAFHAASILGSGSLRTWIAYIESGTTIPVGEGKIAVGLALSPSMEPAAFVALLPILTEKMMEELLSVMNERTEVAESTTTGILRFMITYIANAPAQDDHLRQTQAMLHNLEMRLKAISLPRSSRNQSQALLLLQVKLLLVIAVMVLFRTDCGLEEKTAYDYGTTITDVVSDIMESLLRYGFDRTMKPIKATMSLETENEDIDDLSVECWVSLMHLTAIWDVQGFRLAQSQEKRQSTFDCSLDVAIDRAFEGRQIGPRASERIWYLALGLAALSQFDRSGTVPSELIATARWPLVRKAMGTLRINSLTEEMEVKKRYQLKPRDKYIKIMIIRCLQLTSVWGWQCDRESFAIATKDLGNVFRERALRNLPNESVGDFPIFIRQFDRTLAEEIDMEESAYNLYLQLVCLCASDIVTSPSDINEARQAASEVKRLMLSIVPFSPVRFKVGVIPTGRQLGALINRFSTATVAVIFDVTLLPYLLGNARKWIDFSVADIESRMTCIRGLMYLGIAARHHGEPIKEVAAALSVYFETIQQEKLQLQTARASDNAILERDRLLVLIVSSFKTMMTTHSYDVDAQLHVKYPDPELLANCWTQRLRSTELVSDYRAGLEVVSCVQSFLDARAAALPARCKVKPNQASEPDQGEESQHSEFSAMGLDFTDVDLLAIDGEQAQVSSEALLDAKVAPIIATSISPGIYALLSNTFSEQQPSPNSQTKAERQRYISALTRCWAECASILVVDHHLRDWDTYLAYGQESWERLGDDVGKRQVGMNFMLNVAQLDSRIICSHSEPLILLILQALVSHQITVEPKFLSTVLSIPASQEHALLRNTWDAGSQILNRTTYHERRPEMLSSFFTNVAETMRSPSAGTGMKPFIYRCINQILATLQQNYGMINLHKTVQRSEYRAFANEIVKGLRQKTSGAISDITVPKLKQFPLPAPVRDVEEIVIDHV